MVKNKINFLKKECFKNNFKNAKTNKQKWSLLKTTGCSKESRDISSLSNFDVNKLNNYYIQLHSSSIIDVPKFDKRITDKIFDFKPIIASDVLDTIGDIKSSAIGLDGISLKFLKIILPYFLDQIINIFNHSLNTFTFPQLWNTLIIRPIAKNNNPQTVSDTRPITINCVLTNFFTSIQNDQIKNFVNSNNLLSTFQSGFRNYHSCTTALMRVSEESSEKTYVIILRIII